ncbi:hypothetical protein [Rubellimicrobium aerolatum]|uniref:NifU family protein n=1 Tax=Rubellimicrobium aerolatum TaxID=490979 RepID=A0ABW0SF04_9RHOB|nr:hypothetical protein [Rubellimicrobium aerolatum]MBP1806495.1 hypothetical protein [Rubellimicrobium aerolatum]
MPPADALPADALPDDAILDDELLAMLEAAIRDRLGRAPRGPIVLILVEEETVEFTALGCACSDCLGPAADALHALQRDAHVTPTPRH